MFTIIFAHLYSCQGFQGQPSRCWSGSSGFPASAFDTSAWIEIMMVFELIIWYECLHFDHGDGDGDGDGDGAPGLAKLAKTSNFMDKLFLLCYPQCPDLKMIILDFREVYGESDCYDDDYLETAIWKIFLSIFVSIQNSKI